MTPIYPIPQTWIEWNNFIMKGRDKVRRPISNNTYVRRKENNNIAIKLHQTDIIVITPRDSIILNTGGWMTVTTKERMNTFTRRGISVWQENKIWYLVVDQEQYNFADGITITRNGKVSGESSENPKEKRKFDKAVREYSRKFVDKFLDGEIDKPGGGDCFFCLFRDENGKTMGDRDPSHIKEHIKEKYYTSALLRNAIDAPNALMSPIAKTVVYQIWWPDKIDWGTNEKRPPSDWEKSITRDQLYKTLVRYIRHQVGIPI